MQLSVMLTAVLVWIPIRGVCEEPGSTIPEDVAGSWELQSYTSEGVKRLASDRGTTFQGQRILLAGESWVEWYTGSAAPPAAENGATKFCCRVQPGQPFGQFDYWPLGPGGEPSSWKKVGIYKLDGDRLVICFRVQQIPGPPVKRPDRLRASKGTFAGLAVYKRIPDQVGRHRRDQSAAFL